MLGTGSSEFRVKALLNTTSKTYIIQHAKYKSKKENHEHKDTRKNFKALGHFAWISYGFLLPDTNIILPSHCLK